MGKVYKILVVGDIMLDHYINVKSDRRAEEADIPVWDELKQEFRLGGAANVAHNLKYIGKDDVDVHLAGICGSSVVSQRLKELEVRSERVNGNETMVKRRFVANDQIIFRHDNFKKFSEDEVEFFEMMINYQAGQSFDAVIFSDYDKGTLTDRVVGILKKAAPFVVVDSKRYDLRMFEGCDVLKVNSSEYSTQVSNKNYENENFVGLFKNVVVTRGSQGADLIQGELTLYGDPVRIDGMFTGRSYTNTTEHFPGELVISNDPTGCGDTHTAAMTYTYLRTQDIRSAVRFANFAAAQVVQKFGTSVPVP